MKRLSTAALLLSGLAACTSAAPTTGPPVVDLHEFAVDASGSFVVGRNDLTVTNSGRFGHTIVIADESGMVISASEAIPPGDEYTFAIDLEAGVYEISCRIVVATDDGRLVDHYEEGMVTRVEVEG